MDKVQVEILGLSENPKSKGAYALVLRELEGPRRLPIVIGPNEAHAIVTELEGHRPPRPMTHDLIRNIIDGLGATLQEIVITRITDGTFYATIVFEYSGLEIDARPSDAIAIAVRFGVPMFVNDDVLNTAGFSTEDGPREDNMQGMESEEPEEEEEEQDPGLYSAGAAQPEQRNEEVSPANLSHRGRLEQELQQAINVEDYERAAKLRDELGRLED